MSFIVYSRMFSLMIFLYIPYTSFILEHVLWTCCLNLICQGVQSHAGEMEYIIAMSFYHTPWSCQRNKGGCLSSPNWYNSPQFSFSVIAVHFSFKSYSQTCVLLLFLVFLFLYYYVLFSSGLLITSSVLQQGVRITYDSQGKMG